MLEKIERISAGDYSLGALSWMFRRAKIAWSLLLQASVVRILSAYQIKSGTLIIDDTDRERSRHTTQIAKVHTIRDKKRAGYFKGQNIVFLLLVSNELTIPVGFEFYETNPELTAWYREEDRLKSKGVPKKYRPVKPSDSSDYPSKKALGLRLLKAFSEAFSDIKIKSVVADCFYCSPEFIEQAQAVTGCSQIISQIKRNQLINIGGRFVGSDVFFKPLKGQSVLLKLRHHTKSVTYCCIKVKVKLLNRKVTLIALKYDNETDFRFIVATDMTWRAEDVIQAFSLRWLVEVFIQDWKSYEGWNQLAKQPGLDGSERGLISSLLSDHALHFHPDQHRLFKNKELAATVGSLREKIIIESLQAFIEKIVNSEDPKALFDAYSEKLSSLFELRSSTKHMRCFNMN